MCGGCQVHVLDRNEFRSFETTLHVILTVRNLYPDKFQFHSAYFDKIMGTSKVREKIEDDQTVQDIIAGYKEELREFEELRNAYLLYD